MFGSNIYIYIYIKERVIYVQIFLLRIFFLKNENHKSRLLELDC
jgi:hypothetical protein